MSNTTINGEVRFSGEIIADDGFISTPSLIFLKLIASFSAPIAPFLYRSLANPPGQGELH
jgi:hypothetical protein